MSLFCALLKNFALCKFNLHFFFSRNPVSYVRLVHKKKYFFHFFFKFNKKATKAGHLEEAFYECYCLVNIWLARYSFTIFLLYHFLYINKLILIFYLNIIECSKQEGHSLLEKNSNGILFRRRKNDIWIMES